MCMNNLNNPISSSDATELLDKAGVAQLLHVSRRTIDNLVARGELPHVRFSKRLVRFPKAAVLRAIAARTSGGCA